MREALCVDFLLDEINSGLLRDIVEHCFRERGFKISRQKKAVLILSVLFSRLVRDFSFEEFLQLLPKKEQKDFLTDLLYHIYYINLTLENLVSKERLFFYLFQTFAIRAREKSLAAIFSSLNLSEKIRCLGFLLERFDEGSFRIMQVCAKDRAPEIKAWPELILRSLIDKKEFSEWALSQESITKDELELILKTIHKEIDQKAAKICQILQSIGKRVTFEEVKRTVLLFGLFNHQVPREAKFLHEYRGLDEKLEQALGNLDKPGVQAFIDSLVEQITTLTANPEHYLEGLKLITFAMPTAGKQLERLFWLPSVAQALNQLKPKQRVPIFIFDQSEPKLFKKNSRYLKKFRQQDVYQLDTPQIVAIAEKIGCLELLVTDKQERFGYGGARNAIFLIAPLLKYYYDKVGSEALFEHLHSLALFELQKDFREVVLEEKRGPVVIHMGDDDIYIPTSTVFCDALFAYKHASEYFMKVGWVSGRRTTWTLSSFDLEYVLNRSPEILLQHRWDDSPCFHGMAGLLTKPKLCLNLPYGHEEGSLQAMEIYSYAFRLPSLHLSGYRFPKLKLPTNRFAGLAELLREHYHYLFSLLLVMDLVDPGNIFKRSALPWNEHAPFKSLSEAINYMQLAATKEEMQRRFFRNLTSIATAYSEKSSPLDFATLNVTTLDSQDIAKATKGFKKLFRKEIRELQKLFELLAHEANLLKEILLKEIAETKRVKEEGTILTPVLVKLLEVIGKASFQTALANLSSR